MYKQLILASQSPRRREILAMCNLPFTDMNSKYEECWDDTISIIENVEKLSYGKAKAIFSRYSEAIVIGADTVVVLEDEILGKPKEADIAKEMLRKLSGKTHHVITAVSILSPIEEITFHSISKVEFYDLPDEMIDAYVKTKEPLDKAGAYGIQGKGSLLVKHIEGDYYSIMGLPIAEVYRTLQKYL